MMSWPFSKKQNTAMDLILDVVHFLDRHRRSGFLRLRIFSSPNRPTLVVATEMPHDFGGTIIGSDEEFAWDICLRFGIDPENLRWVEHHPGSWGEGFAWLDFGRPVDGRFVEYWWQYTTKAEVEAFIGQKLAD